MAGREKEKSKEQETMEAAAEEAVNPKEESSEESVAEDMELNSAKSNPMEGDSAETKDPSESEDTEEDGAADADGGVSEESGGEENQNDQDSSDSQGSQDKKEKKRHFIKTEKKEDKLKEQLNELNDKVVRQMAEFDNYRKRTEKEKQAMFETGAKSVIEKLLPVVDNFERGLAALEEGAERTPFEEGVLMTYKQLMTELEKLEVKPLDAVGKEFDPNLHNAVMHVDDESLGENIVVEELQKGYTYRDSVVRHSMVKVAN